MWSNLSVVSILLCIPAIVLGGRVEKRSSDGTVDANYLGCYIDSGNRIMKGLLHNFGAALTPGVCNTFCSEKGFVYSGTQNSDQCFCSTTKPPDDKKTLEKECNKECKGEKSKLCGGYYRMNVRSTEINRSPQTDGTADVNYLGCYVDSGNRIMKGHEHNFGAYLTPGICNIFCLEKGFAYSGTQNSNQCFCSTTKPPDDKKTLEKECNKECLGDKSQLCGGYYRMNVRSTEINRSPQTGGDSLPKPDMKPVNTYGAANPSSPSHYILTGSLDPITHQIIYYTNN